MADDRDVPECDCCGFEAPDLKEYRLDAGGTNTLCGLCAGTMTGMWHEYRRQHDADTLEIMETICFVGNAILAAIRDTPEARPGG